MQRKPDSTDTPSPLRGPSRVGRVGRWIRDHLLGTLIGVVLGALATILVTDPVVNPKARACKTDIDSNGAINRPAAIRILKRKGKRNAFVVDGGVLHHIPDTGTYIHNASCFPVQFNVDDAELARQGKDGSDAESPTGTQPRVGPKLLKHNYLLRSEDEKRWWQVVDGRRLRIASGRTFDCLTKHYLVWDHLSREVVLSFPRHKSRRRGRCRG